MRPPGSAEQLERRRLCAAELYEENCYTQSEIFQRLKVHLRTVQRWLKNYRDSGTDGLLTSTQFIESKKEFIPFSL